MSIFSPFRVPSHRRFNYRPRYYDPDREELAARKARIRHEMEEAEKQQYNFRDGADRHYIRGSFRHPDSVSNAGERGLAPLLTNLGFAAGIVGSLILYRYATGYENIAIAFFLGSFVFFIWRKIIEYRG